MNEVLKMESGLNINLARMDFIKETKAFRNNRSTGGIILSKIEKFQKG